jgi:hypothetical protein
MPDSSTHVELERRSDRARPRKAEVAGVAFRGLRAAGSVPGGC